MSVLRRTVLAIGGLASLAAPAAEPCKPEARKLPPAVGRRFAAR